MSEAWRRGGPRTTTPETADVIPGEILAGPESGTLTGESCPPEEWRDGGILVTRELDPSLYSQLRSSAAVICSSGGLAGHMSAVCRARGTTVMRVAESDLHRLTGTLRIDRDRRQIVVGGPDAGTARTATSRGGVPAPTGSTCAVVSGSEDIDTANASGWGSRIARFFVREEFLCLEAGLSPLDLLGAGRRGSDAYAREMAAHLVRMLGRLQPHQKIIFRLLDLRSDDAATITKNVVVGSEPNPELGLHGTRWIVETSAYLSVVRSVVHQVGEQAPHVWDRLDLAGPFVTDGVEFARLRAVLELPAGCRLSAFVETPAGVYDVPVICEAGAAEVFVGTKDLVQLTLAADRGNHRVAGSYDTRHPAVLDALARTIRACRERTVPVRVFSFARDLDHYMARLPRPTGYMMDTAELLARLEAGVPGGRATPPSRTHPDRSPVDTP